MSNKNDLRNATLLKQIESKEKTLKKPILDLHTNCSLELYGQRYNLNVLRTDDLVSLKVMINALIISAKDMGMNPDNVKLSNYPLTEWMHDLDNKIEMVKFREEEKTLESMKNKLNKLLSEDKRTEMALDDIEEMLNNM